MAQRADYGLEKGAVSAAGWRELRGVPESAGGDGELAVSDGDDGVPVSGLNVNFRAG